MQIEISEMFKVFKERQISVHDWMGFSMSADDVERALKDAAQQSVQSDDGYCKCGGEGYVMLLSGAKICNICKGHRR